MSGIKIPVPVFVSCDETSLKVRVVETKGTEAQDSFPPKGYTLKLECKEMHQEWGGSDVRAIAVDDNNTFNGEDIGDLEPGNPYFVRFVLVSADGSTLAGPETVFDTKPVDCTPKTEKKCTIC